MSLEYATYDKMVMNNVNNYLSVTTDGKVKRKGSFVTYEQMLVEEAYHKSLSQPIVPYALEKYFLSGIPVEETIMNCDNIYDFCKMFNASHGWKADTCDIEFIHRSYEETVGYYINKGWVEIEKNLFIPPNGNAMGGVLIEEIGSKVKIYKNIEPQQKTNRYYISTNGKTFRKIKEDKVIEIEAGGKLVTIFNKFEDAHMDDYNIDYDYYINECYKIIHVVDGTEERLLMEAKKKKEEEKREKEEEKFKKFCIDKVPTVRQLELYGKDWLIEKYGKPLTK